MLLQRNNLSVCISVFLQGTRKDNFPKFVAFLRLKETFHLNFDLLNQDMLIYTGHKVLEGYKLVYLIPI